MSGKVFLFSASQGLGSHLVGVGVLYYGKAYQVAIDAPESELLELEARMVDEVMTLKVDGGARVPDAIVERYDFFEPGTDIMWVVYRVPFCDVDDLPSLVAAEGEAL